MDAQTPNTTKGAALRLAELLVNAGWSTSTLQAYRGAALADDLQQALAPPETTLVQAEGESHEAFQRRAHAHTKLFRSWEDEPYAVTLTHAQAEVARACVKKFASEGRLKLDRPAAQVIKLLELDKE